MVENVEGPWSPSSEFDQILKGVTFTVRSYKDILRICIGQPGPVTSIQSLHTFLRNDYRRLSRGTPKPLSSRVVLGVDGDNTLSVQDGDKNRLDSSTLS